MQRSRRTRTAKKSSLLANSKATSSHGHMPSSMASLSSAAGLFSPSRSTTPTRSFTRLASSSSSLPSSNLSRSYVASHSQQFLTRNRPLSMVGNVFASTTPLFANPKQKKTAKKKGGDIEEEEDAFAGAGDVKKRIKNWMEKILTTKPQPMPLPEAAQENEAQFVQECQARFAARLDLRSRHEMAKITVKQRAIAALPTPLREEALKEDNALWSMQIISPTTYPPRKRWLMEHYQIPYTPSTEELEAEEAQKKRYARFV